MKCTVPGRPLDREGTVNVGGYENIAMLQSTGAQGQKEEETTINKDRVDLQSTGRQWSEGK